MKCATSDSNEAKTKGTSKTFIDFKINFTVGDIVFVKKNEIKFVKRREKHEKNNAEVFSPK